MHLLRMESGQLKLKTFYSNIPLYAILSHRWWDEEPTYQDIQSATAETKSGYAKLLFCAKQAKADGLEYFWVDTVCIDKTSSAELTEAINSMFRWYQRASRCYAYLSDVSDDCSLGLDFKSSEWFRRGWTLQELLAPHHVEFFSCEGSSLGTKYSLADDIATVTAIPAQVIERKKDISLYSVDERMSWVEKRQTTREEDKAYCLLGIFEVFMPAIYGEGANAFRRLKEEIQKLPSAGESSANTGIQKLNVNKERGKPRGENPKAKPRPKSGAEAVNNGYNCFGNPRLEVERSICGIASRYTVTCLKCGLESRMKQKHLQAISLQGSVEMQPMVMFKYFHSQHHYSTHGYARNWQHSEKYRCFVCKDGVCRSWSETQQHILTHTLEQIYSIKARSRN